MEQASCLAVKYNKIAAARRNSSYSLEILVHNVVPSREATFFKSFTNGRLQGGFAVIDMTCGETKRRTGE